MGLECRDVGEEEKGREGIGMQNEKKSNINLYINIYIKKEM